MAMITALLGPTNTGKTHRAVTQMLTHRTGMIGLPLRLLAREVYDRVSAEVGEAAVALVTGEEKRVPARARYWVCTVESMPEGRDVDFLAVDEVQLAAHHERGHVFTDRLMRARGVLETMFLGSDAMTGATRELVPTATVERHPRFSRLRGVAPLELTKLPPRTAVVAFSADQVYALAEQLRRRRGGAAVVLGALSPRTRNAQVAMYQAGEVDYLVATDAIGMGLNMDVDHVAFAALSKFDGRASRALEAAELAQIAGRAGRYMKDGTFGPLAALGPLPQGLVLAIERHQFPPVERVMWRSPALDYSSVDGLVRSLRTRPPRAGLQLLERSDDEEVLADLAAMTEVRALASRPEAVELLWGVCRIPDYSKLLEGSHARLLAALFVQLARAGELDPAWIDRRVRRLDDTEGDIEALMSRIAAVRTWTYISHRPGWIAAPQRWQEWTRAIEDRLSDALHERLTQRFVDPRGATRGRGKPVAAKDSPFGRLRALQLPDSEPAAGPTTAEAAVAAAHGAFTVDARGRIELGGRKIAQMTRGPDLLRPEVQVLLDMSSGAGSIAQVRRRMVAWTRDMVAELLAPLRAGPELAAPSPAGRGLLYQLEHGLGSVERAVAEPQVRALTASDRKLLARLGVEVGALMVYASELLSPWSVERRAALWAAKTGTRPRVPGPAAWLAVDEHEVDRGYFHAIGYPPFGPRAIRADLAERVFAQLLAGPAQPDAPDSPPGPGAAPQWLGCSADELEQVAWAMGLVEVEGGRWAAPARRAARGRGGRRSGRAGSRSARGGP